MTFEECDHVLGRELHVLLAPNTFLYSNMGRTEFCIRLYMTTIIYIHKDSYKLFTGGHHSRLTVNRMNRFGPGGLHFHKKVLCYRNQPFTEGMVIPVTKED